MDHDREVLVHQVAVAALADAGLKRDDIDTVITANNDYLDGRTISNMRLVEPSGAWMKDESKAEMDGAYAALYALMRLLTGHHDTALVIGVSQASVYAPWIPGIMTLDPTWDRERGLLNEVSGAALMARAYMDASGATEADLAAVASKNFGNAARNPLALVRRQMSVEEILSSRMLYSPLREMMVAKLCDGACAVVLAAGDKAREINDKPIWIKGVGFNHDSYLTERDLSGLGGLRQAAKRCYAMAGIKDPVAQIDVAEVHENFAHEELMAYEALDFCGKGAGAAFLKSGATAIGGKLPVNPSGGAMGANVACCTGLTRIAEAALQLRGEAGERQVKGAKTALAHGQTGIAAQENVVFLLGGE